MARKGTTTFNGKTGVWRTVGGRRIFIATGQSLEDAMRESGKFDNLGGKAKSSDIKSMTRKEIEAEIGVNREKMDNATVEEGRELRRRNAELMEELDRRWDEAENKLKQERKNMTGKTVQRKDGSEGEYEVLDVNNDYQGKRVYKINENGEEKWVRADLLEESKKTSKADNKKRLEENERVAKDAYDKAVDKWQYARDRYEAGSEPYEKAKREYENATRAYTDAGRATSEYYADEYRKSVENTKGPGAIQKQYGLKDVRNEADVYDFMEGRLGTEDFEFSMQRGGESQETIDKIVSARNTAERLKNEYQKTAADNLAKARAEAAKQQKAWDDKVRNIQIDTAISKYQKYGKDLNKLREEQSKYDWQSEEYKAIGANITEVAKKRTALKKEALTKFNESMPDDEMYKVAEEISGVKGLTFTKKMHTNYENREYPVYESNDISDKAGVFGNVIKSARIETFNSSLSLDEETGEPHYWGTMSLRYESKNGGSNGMELMDIRYDRKSGWQIKDASGYIYQNGKKLSTVSQMKQYFIDRGYSASSAQDMATEYINNRIVR